MTANSPHADSAVAHPLRILVVVLLVVFAAEGAIMLVLPAVSPWAPGLLADSLVDSTLLVTLTAPALWFVIVRPLRELSLSRGALLRHVYEAQERERARIGRDLHDGVGQHFTALLMGLRGIEQAPALDEARRWAAELHAAAAAGLEEVRRLARGLRPTVLEEFGLASAAARLCEDARAAFGLRIDLVTSLQPDQRFDPAIELAAYRVLQEALTNVARHAEAKQIHVRLVVTGRELLLEVADDGRGFETQSARRSTASLGIQSMRERARMMSGSLEVESAPGQGATVCLRLPVGA